MRCYCKSADQSGVLGVAVPVRRGDADPITGVSGAGIQAAGKIDHRIKKPALGMILNADLLLLQNV